jgi:hypothetical protein
MVNVDLIHVHLVYLFYGHSKYFMAIWYILSSVGIFCPVLVCCSKKNLATLLQTQIM